MLQERLLKFAAGGFRKERVHHGGSGEREAHQEADRRPMRAGHAVEQRLEQEPQRTANRSSNVREFARASGRLAKTDAIDAAVLAHFAEVMKPERRRLPDPETRKLRALVTRREQLVQMMTAEKDRLRTRSRSSAQG